MAKGIFTNFKIFYESRKFKRFFKPKVTSSRTTITDVAKG